MLHREAILASLLTSISLPTMALAAQPVEPSGVVEEIIVTANRREARLQDVPAAVTALSKDALRNEQVISVSALQRVAPSLNIRPFPGDPSQASFFMRGLGSQDALPTIDPAVGLYLDGVYIARSPGANLDLFDVDRVEVLRGSQGTLFGRNTIGGAINIIPTKPSRQLGGLIQASVGNYNAWGVGAVYNTPVGQDTAVRLSYQHQQHGGYAHSSVSGRPLNDADTDYGRLQILHDFSSNLSVLLSADGSNFKNHGQWVTLVNAFPKGISYVDLVSGGRDSLLRYVDPYTRTTAASPYGGTLARSGGVQLTATGTFGAATVKSISSYRSLYRRTSNDLDGTPYNLSSQTGTLDTQNQFSQELQAYGKLFSDRLDWIGGIYYFREASHDLSFSPTLFPQVSTTGIKTEGQVHNTSKAVYAQVTYDLTNQVRLTGGIRYTEDTRELTSYNSRLNGALTVVGCGIPTALVPTCALTFPKSKFHFLPFTAVLDYKPVPNVLAYVKFSRGFRSGGFNLRAASVAADAPFAPEQLDTVEGGLKADLFQRHFRVNLSIYHSVYQDIQLAAQLPAFDAAGNVIATTTIITNAGTAHINGGEIETTTILGPVTITANLGVLDPHYVSISPLASAVTLASPFVDSPKYSGSVGLDYTIPAPFGHVVLHADYNYRSRTFFAAAPPAGTFNQRPPYSLVNILATAYLDRRKIELSVYARNLLDKRYLLTNTDFSAVGFSVGYPGDPRTFGASIRYSF